MTITTSPTILLTSVFGPYATDDRYGSRRSNPMELFHNQVTREQGPFSLRMFHRSWGLKFIQENLEEPSVLLDFPSRERFIAEIRKHHYRIIGISSIYVNFDKVKEMCRLIREIRPAATIVIGGHIAAMPGLRELVKADHVVMGDGIRWFREFLHEDADRPIRHPYLFNEISPRVMGVRIRESTGRNFAVVVPSVGCPIGCEFCSTSAMFGGKGRFVNFYETGDELFAVMCDIERRLKTRSFIVMDENFLLHKTRARRLLELIEQHNKQWSFFVFSSAHAVKQYTVDELVRLGIWMVWMGLECEDAGYEKLRSIDTRKLVTELQSHGIHVLGSTIIGMKGHAPKDIDAIIERAVSHNTVFHQFMLYMPLPGTPLYAEYEKSGILHAPDDFPIADAHGQYKFNYRHGSIEAGLENKLLGDAFRKDLAANGPSIIRFFNTSLAGWKRYRHCADKRIRKRILRGAMPLLWFFPGILWAAGRILPDADGMRSLLSDMERSAKRELPWLASLFAVFVGPFLYHSIRSEEKRLKKGIASEPPTFCEVRADSD